MKLNKRSLIISIASLALGLAAFITFLVLFINSYEASGEYSYEKYDGTLMYESDFTFNQDYAIGIILGIVLISYGVYALYKVLKENTYDTILYVNDWDDFDSEIKLEVENRLEKIGFFN